MEAPRRSCGAGGWAWGWGGCNSRPKVGTRSQPHAWQERPVPKLTAPRPPRPAPPPPICLPAVCRYSIVPVVTRDLTADDELCGQPIPKGSWIICHLQVGQRPPRHHPAPHAHVYAHVRICALPAAVELEGGTAPSWQRLQRCCPGWHGMRMSRSPCLCRVCHVARSAPAAWLLPAGHALAAAPAGSPTHACLSACRACTGSTSSPTSGGRSASCPVASTTSSMRTSAHTWWALG